MKDITFCKVCNIEINQTLLYEHILSKELEENEESPIVIGMTYCELYSKETRNDEWRKYTISE